MGRYRTTGTRKRKREKGAPTFVCTIPLRSTPRKVKTIETRFEVARLAYNAALGECFQRIEKIRSDPRWADAQALAKQVDGHSNPERSALYTALREDYGFTKRALGSYGSSLRKHFIRDHIGAQEAQVIAERAYTAANAWFVRSAGGHVSKPRVTGSTPWLQRITTVISRSARMDLISRGRGSYFLSPSTLKTRCTSGLRCMWQRGSCCESG